jgi:secreted PhoX family phosphatase
VYLSEDRPDGRLYRFVPSRPGDLTAGQLSAASVVDGRVAWVAVASDRPERSASTTAFNGGEGVIVDGSALLLTTKGDDRIWQFDLRTDVVSVFYDGRLPDGSVSGVLSGVDQIIMHPATRDLYVAEDGGDLQLVRVDVGAGAGTGALVPFLQFVGHDQSEVTGPAFSPDGSRLYVSSQRGTDGRTGVTLEISGRFPTLRGVASVSGRDPAVRVDPPGN